MAPPIERGLSAELHDDPVRLLDLHDVEHIFQRQGLEVQAIRGVVIGADGFRVTVDHDGLEAVFSQSPDAMDAAVVELDALTDTVRATPENDDLAPRRRISFALVFVRRIEIGCVGFEFGGAGIDALKGRNDACIETLCAYV